MKNKGGRPKKEFDEKEFEKLCALQCTKDEICYMFECDEKTLTRWCNEVYKESFEDIYKIKSVVGKISLRRTQFKIAERNPGMAIFLGKQYLGQKDNVYVENESLDKIDELLRGLQENAKE